MKTTIKKLRSTCTAHRNLARQYRYCTERHEKKDKVFNIYEYIGKQERTTIILNSGLIRIQALTSFMCPNNQNVWLVVPVVQRDQVTGQPLVVHLVLLVQNQENQVKPTQQITGINRSLKNHHKIK